MIWDWLVERIGKYCSIRRIEYPEFQTGIFGRMESAHRYRVCDPCCPHVEAIHELESNHELIR